jgi:hypothetical protein
MVPRENPALWVFASSCIQLVLLHLMTGQVYSFSGKKEDVSKLPCHLITKRPKQSAVPSSATCSAHLFLLRLKVLGLAISVADFFDWHGRPQDVDLEVYQQLT